VKDTPKPMDLCDMTKTNKAKKASKAKREKKKKEKETKKKEKEPTAKKEKKEKEKKTKKKEKEPKAKKEKKEKENQDKKQKKNPDKDDDDGEMTMDADGRKRKQFAAPPYWAKQYCRVHQDMCFSGGSSRSTCCKLNDDETKVSHAFSDFLCSGFSSIDLAGKGLFLDVPKFLEQREDIKLKQGMIPKGTILHVTTYRSDERVLVFHFRSRSHCRSLDLIRIITHTDTHTHTHTHTRTHAHNHLTPALGNPNNHNNSTVDNILHVCW
jgi:flagellar biosynthesis GTPase FlhF